MENLTEILKTIKQYFHLLLGISATGLALLLSPKENDYKGQLSELNTLKRLDPRQYENYARGFIGVNSLLPYNTWAQWEDGITSQIKKAYTQRNETINLLEGKFPNPDWEIKPIIIIEKPLIDGTLKDWEKWIKSKVNANYYTPDWSSANTSMSQQVGNELIIVRHFILRQSEYKRNPGEYSYRAYLDKEINEIDTSKYPNIKNKRWNWWSRFDTISSQTFFENKNGLRDSIGNQKRFIIEGDVDSKPQTEINGTSVYNWLQKSNEWKQISKTDELGESILPELHSVWTEVSDKSINDAIAYLTNKRNEAKTISLIGISVSFLLALIIIPLAYFLVSVYLLLHLKYLNRKMATLTENITFPWIGLYDFTLARLITFLTFIAIPLGLCIGIIIRYNDWVDKNLIVLSSVLTFFVFLTGIAIEFQNKKIRKTIKKLTNK